MNKFELGKHIDNFLKLNPKKNKFLKINQDLNESFFVIKNMFKKNIKYIMMIFFIIKNQNYQVKNE